MSAFPVSSPTRRVDQGMRNIDIMRSPGTPRLNSTGSTLCSSGEFLKLTPVKILEFDSPIAKGLSRSTSELQASKLSTVDGIYKENFTVITKQLEKLLEDLNVIYRDIGYSNTEILTKEKQIFNTISDSIKEFFNQAESEMSKLTINIEIEQDILNKILEIIGDPSGIKTIPDLYIRNAILQQTRKTVPQSPKKPLSLLNKKNILESAREYIYNVYLPELTKFLEKCLDLQHLTNAIGMDLKDISEEEKNILNNLNESDNLEQIYEYLTNGSPKNKISLISEVIKKNKAELLNNPCLRDLSTSKYELISNLLENLKVEYLSRIDKVCTEGQRLEILLKDLRLDARKVIPKKMRQILDHYRNIDSFSIASIETYFEVSKSSLAELHLTYDKYNKIHEEKSNTKHLWMLKCKQLWNLLNTSNDHIKIFVESNSDLSDSTMENIHNELERLEEMKKNLIKELIDNTYKKVEKYWDILQYSEEEKKIFSSRIEEMRHTSNSLQDDEDTLEICETEVKKLEEQYSLYKPVLDLYEEFNSLLSDQAFLEASSKDSSRLLARNSHKILLKEEKTRKRITRHFPRVILELKDRLIEMESKFNKPFLVDGVKVLDIVSVQEKELQSKYPRSRIDTGNRQSLGRVSSAGNGLRVAKPVITNSGRKVISGQRTTHSNRGVINQGKTSIARSSSDLSDMEKAMHRRRTDVNVSTALNRNISNLSQKSRRHNFGYSSTTILSSNNATIKTQPRLSQTRDLKPRQLFPLSVSKQNVQPTKIPILEKKVSFEAMTPGNKENVDYNQEIDRTRKTNNNYASPYQESAKSVYKLSMSPEGKPKLDVEQNAYNISFDENSFFEN
ncbi:Microtubule associated protein (MAP65/ASE1 family) [Nakaseomyces glabratus]|nr:Microtubule associated protein (MAP65/ASE1 family) [Nakaseomyces glabratus]